MLLGRKRIPRSFEHASRARNAGEPHRRGAPPASLTQRPQAEGFERPQPKAAVPSPVPPPCRQSPLRRLPCTRIAARNPRDPRATRRKAKGANRRIVRRSTMSELRSKAIEVAGKFLAHRGYEHCR